MKRTKELIIMKVRIVVTAGYMIKRSTEMIIISQDSGHLREGERVDLGVRAAFCFFIWGVVT